MLFGIILSPTDPILSVVSVKNTGRYDYILIFIHNAELNKTILVMFFEVMHAIK